MVNKKIVVLGLCVIFIFLVGCTDVVSSPVKEAPLVYTYNGSIDSADSLRNIFSEISNNVINETAAMSNPQIEKLFQYENIEEREWQNDIYWHGDFNEKLFVITIPIVEEEDVWSYERGEVLIKTIECKAPSENVATNAETGEKNCGSGFVETTKNAKKLRYLVDREGNFYFAGVY